MAFISSGGNVIAFAEYQDVTACDQRVFEANEGIADETMVEDLTIKATSRILQLIKNTSWWRSYYMVEATSSQRQATNTRKDFLQNLASCAAHSNIASLTQAGQRMFVSEDRLSAR